MCQENLHIKFVDLGFVGKLMRKNIVGCSGGTLVATGRVLHTLCSAILWSDFVPVVASFGSGVYSQGPGTSAKLFRNFEHQPSFEAVGQPEDPRPLNGNIKNCPTRIADKVMQHVGSFQGKRSPVSICAYVVVRVGGLEVWELMVL